MPQVKRLSPVVILLAALLTSAAAVRAQGLGDLEKKVVEKTLPNGLKVLILPRPAAPVVSMVTYADVGGVDENQNATGLAHIFEHMAFKGTTTIGTKDYAKEKAAMKKEDEAFAALRAERLRRPRPDPDKVKQLEEALTKAQDEARAVRRAERDRRDHRAGRRPRPQRLHQLRPDRLPLLAAVEPARAVGHARGRPLQPPGAARVLQGEGRDHGGEADGREPAHRPPVHRLHAARLQGASCTAPSSSAT